MVETVENAEVIFVDCNHAAKLIGIQRGTLDQWRTRGVGPAYSKIVGVIRYNLKDLMEFIAASRVEPAKQLNTRRSASQQKVNRRRRRVAA